MIYRSKVRFWRTRDPCASESGLKLVALFDPSKEEDKALSTWERFKTQWDLRKEAPTRMSSLAVITLSQPDTIMIETDDRDIFEAIELELKGFFLPEGVSRISDMRIQLVYHDHDTQR